MPKPRICLISTGGTIGMVREGGFLRPASPSLLLTIAPELKRIADVTFVPLLSKDSVNITPDDWTVIAQTIHDRMDPAHGFDGFVVAHGTDTMQYTASALAYAFGPDLAVPIVLTGSQTDASSVHGDARTNLVRAVLVAGGPIAEVVIVFGDHVFRGVRAQKRDRHRFAAFESPAFPPLAEIAAEIIVHPDARRRSSHTTPPPSADFSPEIIQISLVPGLHPATVMPVLRNTHMNGVILQTFGAGNVPDAGTFSFVPFIETATAAGLPVILTSQFPASSTIDSPYATGAQALNAGAIPTGNMTSSAAYVKFRWVLAQLDLDLDPAERLAEVQRRMTRPYVGELDAE